MDVKLVCLLGYTFSLKGLSDNLLTQCIMERVGGQITGQIVSWYERGVNAIDFNRATSISTSLRISVSQPKDYLQLAKPLYSVHKGTF